jgi:hypothetical protein
LPSKNATLAKPTTIKYDHTLWYPLVLFAKWGIDFMTCHPHSARGHGYIIVAVYYFMKWVEAMPTFENTRMTTTLFMFNHIIARFGVPQAIITDHDSHFRKFMMFELTEKLGLHHDNSTPYYP